jgi:hypothetical protein
METKRKDPVADTRSVDTSDDYAVNYWTQELSTTKVKLLAAVAEVGDSFEAVKRKLKKFNKAARRNVPFEWPGQPFPNDRRSPDITAPPY